MLTCTDMASSSTKPALSNPASVDFSKCVLDVASLDFFLPNRDKSPGAAKLGEEALRCEDFLRLETSNIEADREDTWLVRRAMVSGLSWLMSRTSDRKCPTS